MGYDCCEVVTVMQIPFSKDASTVFKKVDQIANYFLYYNIRLYKFVKECIADKKLEDRGSISSSKSLRWNGFL